jgi:predicted RNase H-like HicB family nuclease
MKDLLFRKVLQEKFDMKYKVNLKKTEEGYAVWVPGLPGCWSQGKSEDEALENIKDAIEAYLNVVDSLTADKATRYVEIAEDMKVYRIALKHYFWVRECAMKTRKKIRQDLQDCAGFRFLPESADGKHVNPVNPV